MRLGEIIKPAKVERCGSRELPVLSMTMHDGIVLQADRFKKAIASKDQSTYKVVKPGQLVVGFPIDEGVLYVQGHPYEGIMSPAYNVWDVDSNTVDPQYLELALHSPQSMSFYRDKMRGTTARRRSLPASTLVELDIPVPSKERQSEIAATLIGIRGEANILSRMCDRLDELVKSRFVEMFGDPIDAQSKWPRKPIKDFCELRIGPFGSALHKQDYIVGGHPLVNPSHIADGRIVPADDLTIGDEKYDEMDAYHLALGDVVLGRRGEIGRCAVVCDEGYLCGTGSMIVRPGQECRSDYLQRVLSFPSFREALERNAVGQTMKNLNAKIVGNAVVVLPTMQAQQEFAAFVQQVDKLKFETQQAINKLQLLYDSLAQEYFGGE